MFDDRTHHLLTQENVDPSQIDSLRLKMPTISVAGDVEPRVAIDLQPLLEEAISRGARTLIREAMTSDPLTTLDLERVLPKRVEVCRDLGSMATMHQPSGVMQVDAEVVSKFGSPRIVEKSETIWKGKSESLWEGYCLQYIVTHEMYHLAAYVPSDELSFGRKYFTNRVVLDASEYCKQNGIDMSKMVDIAFDLEEGLVDLLALNNTARAIQSDIRENTGALARAIEAGAGNEEKRALLSENKELRGISNTLTSCALTYMQERNVMGSIILSTIEGLEEATIDFSSSQTPGMVYKCLSEPRDTQFLERVKEVFGKPLLVVFAEEYVGAPMSNTYQPHK